MVAVALLAVPLAFWNDGKYLIGGDDSLLYYVYPLRMLKYYALNVAADNNLSTINGYGQQLYLAPFLVLLAATKAALPGVNTQLLWYGMNLAGGFVATFLLLAEFRTGSGSAVGSRTAAALLYSVSVFSYFTVWSTQLFPLYLVVIYPLVSLLFLRAVRLGSLASLVAAGVVVGMFSIVLLSTPWLLGLVITSALPFLWAVWPYRRRAVLYGALFALLILLLNFHWIVHAVNAAQTASAKVRPTTANLGFGAGDANLISEVSHANSVLYPMLNLFHVGLLERFGSANLPIYSKWSTKFLIPNAVLFAVIPLAAFRARYSRSRATSLFVVGGVSWLLGLFLFTAQLGSWGVELFLFLSRNLPGFVMFRNMYDKFGVALALASAVLLFASLQLLAQERVPETASPRGWLRAVPSLVAILMVIEAGPFLLGRYYDHPFFSTANTYNTVTELNRDFRNLSRALSSTEESGRYAWLPLNAANYVQIEDEYEPNHVYSGVSPLLFLSRKNDLSGQLSFGAFGPSVVDAVLSHDWVGLGELLQRFNVRFLIVNNQISPDLQQSYLFGARARGDLYEAQQDPELPAVLLGDRVADFGRRYSLYAINPRFQSERVSVVPAVEGREFGGRVSFSKRAPHLYDVKLMNVSSGDAIQFLDPFNPQWKVVSRGNVVPLSHEVVFDYANRWEVDLPRLRSHVAASDFVDHGDGTADVRVQLRFEGQRLFRPAMVISLVTASACLLFLFGSVARRLLLGRRRRRPRPIVEAEPSLAV